MAGGAVQETSVIVISKQVNSSHTASDTYGNAATYPERREGRRERVSVNLFGTIKIEYLNAQALNSQLRPPETLLQIAQASPGGAINNFVAILLIEPVGENPPPKNKGRTPVEVWIEDA
jgi:hypothetical protein